MDWTDEDPSIDTILESVTLYWLTGCAHTNLWSYRHVSPSLPPLSHSTTPSSHSLASPLCHLKCSDHISQRCLNPNSPTVPRPCPTTTQTGTSRNPWATAISPRNSFRYRWRGRLPRGIWCGVRSTRVVDILLHWRSRRSCWRMLRNGRRWCGKDRWLGEV